MIKMKGQLMKGCAFVDEDLLWMIFNKQENPIYWSVGCLNLHR